MCRSRPQFQLFTWNGTRCRIHDLRIGLSWSQIVFKLPAVNDFCVGCVFLEVLFVRNSETIFRTERCEERICHWDSTAVTTLTHCLCICIILCGRCQARDENWIRLGNEWVNQPLVIGVFFVISDNLISDHETITITVLFPTNHSSIFCNAINVKRCYGAASWDLVNWDRCYICIEVSRCSALSQEHDIASLVA